MSETRTMTERLNPCSVMEPAPGLNSREPARAMGPALAVGMVEVPIL